MEGKVVKFTGLGSGVNVYQVDSTGDFDPKDGGFNSGSECNSSAIALCVIVLLLMLCAVCGSTCLRLLHFNVRPTLRTSMDLFYSQSLESMFSSTRLILLERFTIT